MFKLAICGINEAPFVADRWATKAVSLLDPGTAFPGHLKSTGHLVLNFDDIEQPFDGRVMPAMVHVERILNFSRAFVESDRVLIHCHAGISRSTAAAIGVCMQHGMTVEDAFAHVQGVRSVLWPNQTMIEHVDKILALGGCLADHVGKWKLAESALALRDPNWQLPVAASLKASLSEKW